MHQQQPRTQEKAKSASPITRSSSPGLYNFVFIVLQFFSMDYDIASSAVYVQVHCRKDAAQFAITVTNQEP